VEPVLRTYDPQILIVAAGSRKVVLLLS